MTAASATVTPVSGRTAPPRRREPRRFERSLRDKLAELDRREKELAREWEKRETAKLKELERRTEQASPASRSSQETIGKMGQTADRLRPNRTPSAASPKSNAKCAKILRPLSSPPGRFPAGTHPAPAHEEGVRVRFKERPRAGARAAQAGRDRIEVEAGFMKLQVSIDDVIEVLPETGGGVALWARQAAQA